MTITITIGKLFACCNVPRAGAPIRVSVMQCVRPRSPDSSHVHYKVSKASTHHPFALHLRHVACGSHPNVIATEEYSMRSLWRTAVMLPCCPASCHSSAHICFGFCSRPHLIRLLPSCVHLFCVSSWLFCLSYFCFVMVSCDVLAGFMAIVSVPGFFLWIKVFFAVLYFTDRLSIIKKIILFVT